MGKVEQKKDEWREKPVEERLTHALIKGFTDYIEEDVEEARKNFRQALEVIEGPLMTANHTSCYLAAAMQEFIGTFNDKRPLVSRAQAKMVGRYYWYSHERATALGYTPLTARQAMAKAISWLVKSDHISGSLRSSMKLSQEVYDQRH